MYTNIAESRAPHHINVATTWEPYGYRFWEPNVATTSILYDRWYRIEWYARWSSTPTADDGIIMGVAHKTHPVHGVQFHPESIASAHGHALLQNFLRLARTAPCAALA